MEHWKLLMLDDKFDLVGTERRKIRKGHVVGQYTSKYGWRGVASLAHRVVS